MASKFLGRVNELYKKTPGYKIDQKTKEFLNQEVTSSGQLAKGNKSNVAKKTTPNNTTTNSKSALNRTLANSDNSGRFKVERLYTDAKTGKTYTEAQMKAKDLSADTAKKEQNDIRKSKSTKTGSTTSTGTRTK